MMKVSAVIAALLIAVGLVASQTPPIVTSESNLLNPDYDVVVFVNDVGTGLGTELASIENAISGYKQINPKIGGASNVIPYPDHPSRKLIFASTGDLSSDLADSRDIYNAAKAAMDKVIAMKLRKILLVVGPMLTALPHYTWAMKHNPKLTAALGALHSLYVPIQVREMTSTKQKFNLLGLFQFGDKLANSTLAVGQGEAVYRDIGNGDPIRMAAPRIAEYLEERKSRWEAAGISMRIVEPNERDHPMAWAVNRAVKDVPELSGRMIYLTYTPKGLVDQTLLIVGKGVTIDTGGADLKIKGVMYGMHNDKMGAASVAGFFEVLSHLQPKGLKVFGYMPCIRNGLDKDAYLPDEIVVARNGLRARIGNTDAEGRVIMSDVLDEARQQALKEANPHIFSIATLTGAAKKAYGSVQVAMDNLPARKVGMAQSLSDAGDEVADPCEVARIRVEDYQVNYGISEYEDVMQFNTKPGSTSKRGFTFPMAYLSLISGLSNHGLSSQSPLPYTHTDIAPSSGGIGTYGTGSPLRMYANRFILSRVLP